MTLEERAEKAKELKQSGQCNCTQSVLRVFEDKINVPAEEIMRFGAGFAAGMGCMEGTCGALIGAVMTAGFITEGKGTPRYSKDILLKFKEKCGSTICNELKGIGTGTMLCSCPDCCKNAVLSMEGLL